jgi:transcriptional regulator with XRE-family HTH domain
MTTHDQYMKKLSPARRAKIKARAKELIAEELTLRELRKARELSQETLADVLGMRQGDLSKFERRADAYLSTIRRYVVAMGGTLDLIVTFPNSQPVKIIHIGDLDQDKEELGQKSIRA